MAAASFNTSHMYHLIPRPGQKDIFEYYLTPTGRGTWSTTLWILDSGFKESEITPTRLAESGQALYRVIEIKFDLEKKYRVTCLDSKETVTLVRSSPDDNEDGFFISGTWRTVEEPFNFWSPEQLYKQQKRKLIKVEECI